jgi:hypothetical protein
VKKRVCMGERKGEEGDEKGVEGEEKGVEGEGEKKGEEVTG